MNMMKDIYRGAFGVLLLLLALASCTENEIPAPEPLPEKEDMRIRWNVESASMESGRALVEDSLGLQDACTVGSAKGGKAIGIWSAYELNGATKKNILGNPSGDVSLRYYEQVPEIEEGVEMDNWQGWLYGDSAVHWTPGAKYTFNAYFPQSVVREISSSDISTFVVEYNSELYQEDLMMAYAYVDTEASSFDSQEPVRLNMLHTLSALRFQFMFMNSDGTTYDDNDMLTACSLENTVSGSGIATTGILAFGTTDGNGAVDGEHIHWYDEDHPEPNTPGSAVRSIYRWEDASGVPFSSTETSHVAATSHKTGNQLYSSNNGWILTIPQHLDETTLLCFKLASTGDLVHHVHLPETTLEPGKRYTYNIRFGQSEVSVKLTIADWNELKSTHNIPL